MNIRRAERSEIAALTRLWYEGWRDAHLAIVPEELAHVRTLESFRDRLETRLDEAHVAGPPGAPLGFYMLKGDELDQLYVSASARGKGVAASLIADAEKRLHAHGAQTAWLACAIGNERAARFYEKSGWHRAGIFVSRLETSGGPFDLNVWRYEKALSSSATASGKS
jgi:GNAT superfamily N-acetyltransferase